MLDNRSNLNLWHIGFTCKQSRLFAIAKISSQGSLETTCSHIWKIDLHAKGVIALLIYSCTHKCVPWVCKTQEVEVHESTCLVIGPEPDMESVTCIYEAASSASHACKATVISPGCILGSCFQADMYTCSVDNNYCPSAYVCQKLASNC